MTVAVQGSLFRRARASAPRPGQSLAAGTEKRAVHVRAAVDAVRRGFGDRESVKRAWSCLMANRWRGEGFAESSDMALQAAWSLVSIRIVGRSVGALSAGASLRDAESWFLGAVQAPASLGEQVTAFADREAARSLEEIAYDGEFRDLLPYVLDSIGPGSRASVMRDPATGESRRARKASGVFYTPSDVAEYIAGEALSEVDEAVACPKVLDPACGSGVFLKAALDAASHRAADGDRFRFVEECLYGIDIDPLAVEAACFVLLRECIDSKEGLEASPWSLWHRIRCNFRVGDALDFCLRAPRTNGGPAVAELRAALARSYVPPDDLPEGPAGVPGQLFSPGASLGGAFPGLAAGADVVIGNPPYAAIGSRRDAADLERRFASATAGCTGRSDCYPLFVEMMWRLARRDGSSSGMVVPLSIACSRRAQLVALRRAISTSGGRWRFAFFDREPHGLFGEEVKTRNAIVFRTERRGNDASTSVETGPLRRWTSRQRAELFTKIDFTRLRGTAIARGIPKLAGDEPARVYAALSRRTGRLRRMCSAVRSCPPGETEKTGRRPTVFVAGTAYNFLSVFRPHRSLPPQRAPWSSSKVLALEFDDEEAAGRAFACLGSRIAYWLWHVSEDGFHVTRSFVLDLPLTDGICEPRQEAALADCGARLWERVQSQQVVSVNGGRQTVSYRPYGSDDVRDEIDALLLDALGLAPSFGAYLRSFARRAVTVDERDPRRRLMAQVQAGGAACSA